MAEKCNRIKIAILKALDSISEPAGASRITDFLLSIGEDLRPRTVRYYLLKMDEEGLTHFISRRQGRQITPRGLEELEHANVMEKMGFVTARVDDLVYRMSYDVNTGNGDIIPNLTTIHARDLPRSLIHMRSVIESGYSMGNMVAMARSGETFGNLAVPNNSAVIATVCSATTNGILLKHGIPVTSRFGGLLEIREGRPHRFVELLEYSGTTLDPLAVFIKARMTSVKKCAETGSGIIGVSFREIPAVAVEDVRYLRKQMDAHRLGGILAIGAPNRPLLDVNVAEGKAGMIVVGGMNPLAAMYEAGVPMEIHSLSCLENISRFSPFPDIARRGRRISPYID